MPTNANRPKLLYKDFRPLRPGEKGYSPTKRQHVSPSTHEIIPTARFQKLAGSTAPSRLTKAEKVKLQPTTKVSKKPTTKKPTTKKLTITDQLPGWKRIDPKKSPRRYHPYKTPYYVDTEGHSFTLTQAKAIVAGKKSIKQTIISGHKARAIGPEPEWKVPNERYNLKRLKGESMTDFIIRVAKTAADDQINQGRYLVIPTRGRIHWRYDSDAANTMQWRVPLGGTLGYKHIQYWEHILERIGEMFQDDTVEQMTLMFYEPQPQVKKEKRPNRKGR